MFLNRFPNNEYSPLRICTLTQHLRGCTGIRDLDYMATEILDSSVSKLLTYIVDFKMAQEITRLMSTDEESDDPFSYFCYQDSLGLVKQSVYSSSSNPRLHNMIHIVGCLAGYTRSFNSRFIPEGWSYNVVKLGVFLFYYFVGWGSSDIYIALSDREWIAETQEATKYDKKAKQITQTNRLASATEGATPDLDKELLEKPDPTPGTLAAACNHFAAIPQSLSNRYLHRLAGRNTWEAFRVGTIGLKLFDFFNNCS